MHFSLYISSCSISISNCFSVSSLFHLRPTAIQGRHNSTGMMNIHYASSREIKSTRVQFLDRNWECEIKNTFHFMSLLNVLFNISVVLCSVVLWNASGGTLWTCSVTISWTSDSADVTTVRWWKKRQLLVRWHFWGRLESRSKLSKRWYTHIHFLVLCACKVSKII